MLVLYIQNVYKIDTDADNSRGSKAFIRVSVCVYYFVHSITQKRMISKSSN